MEHDSTKGLSKVIRIDESEIRGHLEKMVRGTVEETLNAMIDAEADAMCKAQRYERSPDRIDTRAGHYTRKLHTKAGEVEIKMPKLRCRPPLIRSTDNWRFRGSESTGTRPGSGRSMSHAGSPRCSRAAMLRCAPLPRLVSERRIGREPLGGSSR